MPFLSLRLSDAGVQIDNSLNQMLGILHGAMSKMVLLSVAYAPTALWSAEATEKVV